MSEMPGKRIDQYLGAFEILLTKRLGGFLVVQVQDADDSVIDLEGK
jgi:hypothetical protein